MAKKHRDRSEIPGIDLRPIRRPYGQAQYLVPGGISTAKANLLELRKAVNNIDQVFLTASEDYKFRELNQQLARVASYLQQASELLEDDLIGSLYALNKQSLKRKYGES